MQQNSEKTINNGQTCIAPDYVLVHETVRESLTQELINQLKKQFPKLIWLLIISIKHCVKTNKKKQITQKRKEKTKKKYIGT